jgi:hypothetical protein
VVISVIFGHFPAAFNTFYKFHRRYSNSREEHFPAAICKNMAIFIPFFRNITGWFSFLKVRKKEQCKICTPNSGSSLVTRLSDNITLSQSQSRATVPLKHYFKLLSY